MILPTAEFDRTCFGLMLMAGFIGLVVGAVPWTDTRGTRLSTVMAARYLPEPARTSVPVVPRATFISLFFSGTCFLRGRCSSFFTHHLVFVAWLVVCWVSMAAWLLAASGLQSQADDERKAHIEEFISSEPGKEPPLRPHLDPCPKWLKIWEAANFAVYLLIMGAAAYAAYSPMAR